MPSIIIVTGPGGLILAILIPHRVDMPQIRFITHMAVALGLATATNDQCGKWKCWGAFAATGYTSETRPVGHTLLFTKL